MSNPSLNFNHASGVDAGTVAPGESFIATSPAHSHVISGYSIGSVGLLSDSAIKDSGSDTCWGGTWDYSEVD